ncbi:MAG: hypothetical protein ACKPEA_11135 [Planctomycetota bacterium]
MQDSSGACATGEPGKGAAGDRRQAATEQVPGGGNPDAKADPKACAREAANRLIDEIMSAAG